MSLKWRKWIFLLAIGLIPILTGCEGCDKKKKYVAPPPAPSAPSNLTATPVSSAEVYLSWKDNSTNEKGFYIYRKTTGSYDKIGIFDANTTSCRHINCTPQTTYWYKVTAYNDGGESNPSNEASATTFGLSPPNAPSNLTGIAVSFSQIDLSWKDNSSDEKGFYIYRKTTGNYNKIKTTGPNTTSYSNLSLSSETTYWYKVTAYNDGGESNASNEISITTLVLPPPTIEILSHYMEEEYWEYGQEWITYIKGQIKNNGSRTYTVWMAAKLFNYNDVMVSISYDFLDPVSPGEIWQFEIVYFGERIKRYHIWVDDYY